MSRVSEVEEKQLQAAAGSLAQSVEPRPLESPWSQAQSSAQHLKHGTETPPPDDSRPKDQSNPGFACSVAKDPAPWRHVLCPGSSARGRRCHRNIPCLV